MSIQFIRFKSISGSKFQTILLQGTPLLLIPHTPICFLRNSCDFRDTTLDAEAGNLSDCRRICYRLRAGETRAYQPNKKIVVSLGMNGTVSSDSLRQHASFERQSVRDAGSAHRDHSDVAGRVQTTGVLGALFPRCR